MGIDGMERHIKGTNSKKIARTEKAARNVVVSTIGQIIDYLLKFVARILLVKFLAIEYLGISGLFSNILSLLCLADMGVAVALNCSLYKPLADKDTEKIKSLMDLYKKTFRTIGGAIVLLGLALLPWYRNFMKEVPAIEHLDVIYVLHIVNTATSYFYSYKRNLIIADQNKYIDSINACIFSFVRNVIQIVVLVLTQNYILYLSVQVACTLLENVSISVIADRNYPYLKEKNIQKLEIKEKREILKNTGAMICHKVGGVVVNGTDNIIISKFVGLVITGIYSNYLLIINMLNSILGQVFNAATASVGNLMATEENMQKKVIFYRLSYLQFYIYTFLSVCLLCLFQPMITVIFGEKLLLDSWVVGIIVLNFYISGMRKVLNIYRDSTGTYYYDRYKPLFEAVINLVVSIVLVQKLGVAGVIIGTIASTMLTCFWIEPLVVFKHVFKESPLEYFVWYLKKGLICLLCMGITWSACELVNANVICGLILKCVICCFVPNILLFLVYRRDRDYIYYTNFIKNIFFNGR